jgi:hypothetical protein
MRPLNRKPPKCEESPFGLSVGKMRSGALFLERMEVLQGHARVDLAA